jgi:nickel transport protein
MQDAQVNVFAPDDPQTPWMNGNTDQNGRFIFSPDPTIPGTWDVQVRQAGHGGILHINLEDGALTSNTTGFSRLQIVLMGACALWGFLGTGLFFYRRGS